MLGFVFDVEFIWGFQAKIVGYSKTSPSFHYPPPTTILGAIAEQLAKENKIGENKGKEIIPKLSQNLLALGIKPLNCIPVKFSDINRLIAIRKTGEGDYPNPRDPYGSFDAPAVGKTLLAPLDGEAPKLRIAIVFKDEKIQLDQKNELVLRKENFWGIHRLGTKESIVSVCNVIESTPEQKRNTRIETQYSFPLLDGVETIEYIVPRWVSETLINPYNLTAYNQEDNPVKNYLLSLNIVNYLIPIFAEESPPTYVVELKNNICSYEMDEGEKVIGICRS